MSTSPAINNRYLWCYEDPRAMPGFMAADYPAVSDAPSVLPDGVGEARERFQNVYARRNACVRTMTRLQPDHPDRHSLAQQILLLTEAIDHLEDVYAPIGLVAEPVMDHTMFTCELVFTHARLTTEDGAVILSSFSIYIPIPPPTDPREDPGAP